MTEAKVPVNVEGRTLTLSNLDKVLYPEDGFTKGEVIAHYQQVAAVLLPHIADRPSTLKRYPEGVEGQSFFQKHATPHRPSWVRTEKVNSRSSRGSGGTVNYVVIDDLATLIWAANLAAIELHVPMWRFADNGEPDLLVFDLDPGAPATIVECCRVAQELRPLLQSGGFDPVAKTSGSKGLQLYARMSGRSSQQASDLAKSYAERLEKDRPDLAVVYPAEGMGFGIDNLFIPVNAPHPENAHFFLDFLMRPEIAVNIAELQGYLNCNAAADALLSEEFKGNPVLYIPPGVLGQTEFIQNVGEAQLIYNDIWTRFKQY